jgi:hypothetical protein
VSLPTQTRHGLWLIGGPCIGFPAGFLICGGNWLGGLMFGVGAFGVACIGIACE